MFLGKFLNITFDSSTGDCVYPTICHGDSGGGVMKKLADKDGQTLYFSLEGYYHQHFSLNSCCIPKAVPLGCFFPNYLYMDDSMKS